MKPKETPMTTTIDRSESQDIIPMPPAAAQPLAVRTDVPIGAILERALDRNVPVDVIEKLVALYKEVGAINAAKAFAEAMSSFKASCPPVPRRTENQQFTVTRDGVRVPRKYASLEDIEATVREPLGVAGLSYRWGDSAVREGVLSLACIVSHVGGHSVASSVSLPVDSKAGCSEQQKYGAAMTYAQRYSLIQALGLTSCDEDTDGNESAPVVTITEEQAAMLDSLITEVKQDRPRFLKWAGVDHLRDMPAAKYAEASRFLEAKRGGR